MESNDKRQDGSSPCYVVRCWSCEGTGTRPSALYLIPFWPSMVCKRCHGSGLQGVTPWESGLVYAKAIRVLRKSVRGDQFFVPCLQGADAEELRLAIVELQEAFQEST